MSRGPGKGPGKGRLDRTERPRHLWRTTLRLFSYLRNYRLPFFASLFLIVVQSLTAVAGNAMLQPVIDGIVEGREASYIAGRLVIMGLFFAASVAASYLSARWLIYVGEHAVFEIRRELFEHSQKLPVAFFDHKSHGDLMSAYVNDADTVTQALEDTLPNVLSAVVMFVGTLTMMLILSPIMAGLVVLLLLVMMLVAVIVGRLSSRYFKARQKDIGQLNGFIEERISGQRVVQVFNMEKRSLAAFDELNETMRQSATLANGFGTVMFPLMNSLAMIQYALTAMFGAFLSIQGRGNMSLGLLATFLQYTRSFSRPLVVVSQQTSVLLAALAGAERIFQTLDEAEEIDDGDVVAENGFWLLPGPDGTRRVKICAHVEFSDVCFAYEEGVPVLNHISFYAKPGQRVALVGSTGAGKTTIVQLLTRFYEINRGQIKIDGIDIRRIRKASLRAITGLVLQDVLLFSGTIEDNIRYGRIDADRKTVEAAARHANADRFIRNLAAGYETELKSDASDLSQGQRQLISIARAAIAEPMLLILDEATSSVDTRTEYAIEKAMDDLMEERTTLAIAHRLSTVKNANVILVLEKGLIVERGDHDELLAARGRYYELSTGLAELT